MKKQIINKISSSAFIITGILGFAALCIWRLSAARQNKKPNPSLPQENASSSSELSAIIRSRRAGADEDELELRPRSQNHSQADQWDQIEMSRSKTLNVSHSNFSTGDSETEIKGADRIAFKKKNVEGFLQKVNINKRKFVRYQTAQHKARLKRRLGIPQTPEEIKELELSKQLASEIQDNQEEYLEEWKSQAHSDHSKFTSRSAPPYLLETPGGPSSPTRRGISVKPKDFKRKDDYVFFDLFTLYAETYMGRKKKQKSSVIEEVDSELRSQE